MKKLLVLIAIPMVIIAVIWSIFYQVDTTQACIVTQFGRPVTIQTEPGLYSKLPWPIQTVKRLDKRIQMYETRLVEYLTGDKKNIVLQAFICWRITDPLEFYRAVRTFESAEVKLDNIVSSLIGSSLGNLKMSNLVSTETGEVKIPDLENLVTERANEEVSKGYGISLEHIGVSRLALSEENAQSVYRRMRAERASIANEYRALGKEEADKIRANADRAKSEILAEAYRTAEVLRGEGDAEAARIYSNAYSKAPEFFQLLRTLEAYKKFLPGKSTLVLRSDSELLQYLNASGNILSTTPEH